MATHPFIGLTAAVRSSCSLSWYHCHWVSSTHPSLFLTALSVEGCRDCPSCRWATGGALDRSPVAHRADVYTQTNIHTYESHQLVSGLWEEARKPTQTHGERNPVLYYCEACWIWKRRNRVWQYSYTDTGDHDNVRAPPIWCFHDTVLH